MGNTEGRNKCLGIIMSYSDNLFLNYFQRSIKLEPVLNPRSQIVTETSIQLVPPVGFEPGSLGWKARKDTTTPA